MSTDAAHKLIVLARSTGSLAADLGMFAGSVHDGGDVSGLRTQLTVTKTRLDAIAASLELITDELRDDGQ